MIFLQILIILVMTCMGSLGAIFLKKSTFSEDNGIKAVLKNKWIYLGLVLYAGGAILNVVLLSMQDYSTVLPLTSITYIWTAVFSAIFYNEKITLLKVIAIALITAGAICMLWA